MIGWHFHAALARLVEGLLELVHNLLESGIEPWLGKSEYEG